MLMCELLQIMSTNRHVSDILRQLCFAIEDEIKLHPNRKKCLVDIRYYQITKRLWPFYWCKEENLFDISMVTFVFFVSNYLFSSEHNR
jgi:hypothetical protein